MEAGTAGCDEGKQIELKENFGTRLPKQKENKTHPKVG